MLAGLLSAVSVEAASFSSGSSKPSTRNSQLTNNRPWGNIGAYQPGLKNEQPPAIPGSRYPGAAPGTGWYAAQLPVAGNPAAGGQPVVEVEIDGAVFYEQQSIVYTVRVVSSENLRTLNPEIPRIEGATLEQVDGPVASTRKSGRNTTRKIINEYHFRLTPLRPGEIVIPAIQFTGSHVSNRQRNAASGMPASRTGNRFSIAADKSLTLQVLPADPAVTPWLPLNDLKLQTYLPENGPAKAGVPVTLTLELTARGALGTQLPSLEQQLKSSGFRAYRESVTTSNGIYRDGTQFRGSRKETYTLIPLQDGRIHLPGIQVAWWDVDTDTPMLAGLSGQHAVTGAAGNRRGLVATGEQKLFSTYFWYPMFIILGVIIGYWLGAWARTRPQLHAAGSRVGNWLSTTGNRVVQHGVTVSKKLSPALYLDKAGMGLALVLPGNVKLWLCLRCIEREEKPEAWCIQFRSRICRHLDLSEHAPITAIASRIVEVQPQVEPARLHALAQSMDNAIYGARPLDFPAWKKDFRQQLRPRLLRRRRPRLRRTGDVLPALNPHRT
jgi:hypothetical protein